MENSYFLQILMRSPRLSDEHSWDDEHQTYPMLDRYGDRKYRLKERSWDEED